MRALLLLLTTLAATLLPAMAANPAPRPNFLFLYTDDQRHDALSVVQREQGARGRFPWFRTPHMDRLAAEGVRFRNAFVVNALCAPSRAVFLTGRYNHHNGVASNFRPFPATNLTHATLLRAAGYTTAYIGKWHMDNQRERPGFDHHASYLGHARYTDPPFILDGRDTPTKGWIDDLSTDYAIQFLQRQQGSPKPWSLIVGFKAPHGPFDPPARARDRFAGERARTVPSLHGSTPYQRAADQARAAATPPPNPDDTVPINLNYFRCVSAIDDCLGRLLDALDTLGFASNTVVIYTSDNGFYLGEHGLGDKRSAYDESLRIPFLVRYPALGPAARGRVVDDMVLNLDLAQTLLDFAGVPAPAAMQGRSWRPLLTGPAPGWRQAWFYEYFAERQKGARIPDITAVRTASAKLIRYPGHEDWTELFDLAADPYELRNLHRDPARAGLRRELEALHEQLAREVGYRVPDYTDRPDWWGKPGGPDWKETDPPPLRLSYDFTRGQDGRAVDRSGLDNHGAFHQAGQGPGRDGHSALRLSGHGHVTVPKSPSLNPANRAWTVEVIARAEKPDGVLLARGGKTHGYALWLQDGRPGFTVVAESKATRVQAPEPLPPDAWTTLAGEITADGKIQLSLNGRVAASAPLPRLIGGDPNDGMELGTDLGSPIVNPPLPLFTGWIESVRITAGPVKGNSTTP
ncbi:MAG: hypothetical protein RJA22_522 [Verrucomicrobiota bacterium]|jgi:arylsulfatase A-like enzyme